MVRHFMTKLDWHATLFPRIPVPIQKQIEAQMGARDTDVKEQERRERLQQREVEENTRQRYLWNCVYHIIWKYIASYLLFRLSYSSLPKTVFNCLCSIERKVIL